LKSTTALAFLTALAASASLAPAASRIRKAEARHRAGRSGISTRANPSGAQRFGVRRLRAIRRS
jgi:hypothetical protein